MDWNINKKKMMLTSTISSIYYLRLADDIALIWKIIRKVRSNAKSPELRDYQIKFIDWLILIVCKPI